MIREGYDNDEEEDLDDVHVVRETDIKHTSQMVRLTTDNEFRASLEFNETENDNGTVIKAVS
jgi:hypothetical protein